MSASDKKKIRKAEVTDFLTERQLAEQAEAKKLRNYTIAFVSAMLLIVVIALSVLGVRAVKNSGIIQKSTIAATIGENKLNSVELSYYYTDAVNKYYSDMYNQFGESTETYLNALGLDLSTPLDEQVQDEEAGKTWAEYFVDMAIEQAKVDYAMHAAAKADNFELDEDDKTSLENAKNNMSAYATLYGFSNVDQYLRAMYGYGSNMDSYMEYSERSAISASYIAAHHEDLSYEDSQIREYEKDMIDNYSSFTYDASYMSYTEFRQGGTENEEGSKTYTEEENNAAREAVKAAAEDMATATNLEELQAKAETVKVNEDSEVVVNTYENQLYSNINASLAKWLADSARKEGDIAAIPNETTTTNDDGTETTVVNGYYVALYHSKNENKELMSNVRHLLVEFECENEDEHEHEDYSAEEKAKAKEEADGYLKTWQEGEKTEESFIELVKEHSDDTSASEGGLFEHINPDSNYVENFLNWSIADSRKAGDCEVIETEYGYHVMYYVGEDDMTYRDYMITEEMRTNDHEEWYNGIVDAVETAVGDTSKMELGLTLA